MPVPEQPGALHPANRRVIACWNSDGRGQIRFGQEQNLDIVCFQQRAVSAFTGGTAHVVIYGDKNQAALPNFGQEFFIFCAAPERVRNVNYITLQMTEQRNNMGTCVLVKDVGYQAVYCRVCSKAMALMIACRSTPNHRLICSGASPPRYML